MTDSLEKTEDLAESKPMDIHTIAERMLGEVEWADERQGYCACPGRSRHTHHSGRRDCAVYLDRVPTLFCVHQSCRDVVERRNHELRKAIQEGCPGSISELSTREMKRLNEARSRCERVRKRATLSLPVMLKNWNWPYEKIVEDSPTPIPEPPSEQTRMLLGGFEPDDVVWIGERYDSGRPDSSNHFKSASGWMKEEQITDPLICPVAFKPNTTARKNENVLTRRFLVVESDVLDKDKVGAVFLWLKDKVELKLVAVIDTAGKSLHAWFDYPGDDDVEELKLVLPALNCDPKLFTASQPVRLAGGLRDGKVQRLVYFNGGAR